MTVEKTRAQKCTKSAQSDDFRADYWLAYALHYELRCIVDNFRFTVTSKRLNQVENDQIGSELKRLD